MPEIDPEIQKRLLDVIRQIAEGGDPDAAARALRDVYGEAAVSLVDSTVKDLPALLADHRSELAGFEARLNARWGRGLDLLEYLIEFCRDAGRGFSVRYLGLYSGTRTAKTDALARLHAKGTLTASEGLTLLRSGYSTAAMARWRTLHETVVTAFVLLDQPDSVAQRFLAHDAADSLRAQKDYEQWWQRLGAEPPDWEPSDRDALRNDLINLYGPVFPEPYGWAEPVVGHPPKFRDLEEAAHLDHLRPYYRMASYGVHPLAKGVLWSLQSLGDRDVLMAGSSNAGLADPGHSLAISLAQLTTALMVHELRILGATEADLINEVGLVIGMQTVLELADRVGDTLLATHMAQVEEERQKAEVAERLLSEITVGEGLHLDALAEAWEMPIELLTDALDLLIATGRISRDVGYSAREDS